VLPSQVCYCHVVHTGRQLHHQVTRTSGR
jgi:hypothetical protein